MKSTWIVVANASAAKCYAARNAKGELELVQELQHPESRMHNRDLVTDIGRDHKNHGKGAPRDGEPAHLPKKVEATRFAHEIADFLKQGRVHGRFERLIVVAPAAFEGEIVAALDGATAKSIVHKIAKDYVSEDAKTLGERLADHIRFDTV